MALEEIDVDTKEAAELARVIRDLMADRQHGVALAALLESLSDLLRTVPAAFRLKIALAATDALRLDVLSTLTFAEKE